MRTGGEHLDGLEAVPGDVGKLLAGQPPFMEQMRGDAKALVGQTSILTGRHRNSSRCSANSSRSRAKRGYRSGWGRAEFSVRGMYWIYRVLWREVVWKPNVPSAFRLRCSAIRSKRRRNSSWLVAELELPGTRTRGATRTGI